MRQADNKRAENIVDEIRARIESLLKDGEWARAQAACEQLWQVKPAPVLAGFLNSSRDKLRGHVPMTTCKVAILRSFTVEPLVPAFKASAFANRIDLDVVLGGYGTYSQDVLDPQSKVYTSRPDVILLAAQTREIAPLLWDEFASLSVEDQKAEADRVLNEFRMLIETIRSRSTAHIIVHNLEKPAVAKRGVLDSQRIDSQAAAIDQVNRGLLSLAAQTPGVYVLDYDAMIARYGRETWHDAVKWSTVNLPMRAEYMVTLAEEWVRYLAPMMGRSAKVLVTDLDNTLWGGVIGEDGMHGIKLGQEYPGSAFRSLQRGMLDLASRGILIAVASKNNPEDAKKVFEEHESMVLRSEHIAAERINWTNKAQNLREIAKELNLGLDSLVFLDDNPAERELIRLEAPEVMVLEASDDPIANLKLIQDSPLFQRLSISEEDAQRTAMYAQQRQRTQLEQTATDLDSYYKALEQQVEIEPLNASNLQRISQLTQKTNQCNLTTKRYSEQALLELAAQPGWHVYSLRVMDRFGDNGITGVAITADRDGVREIDSLLLSCRVLGRTVETSLLSYLTSDAEAQGLRYLRGWFHPTKKNAPSKDLYSSHGFETIATEGESTYWSLDLQHQKIHCPEWIQLTIREREFAAA